MPTYHHGGPADVRFAYAFRCTFSCHYLAVRPVYDSVDGVGAEITGAARQVWERKWLPLLRPSPSQNTAHPPFPSTPFPLLPYTDGWSPDPPPLIRQVVDSAAHLMARPITWIEMPDYGDVPPNPSHPSLGGDGDRPTHTPPPPSPPSPPPPPSPLYNTTHPSVAAGCVQGTMMASPA